MQLILRYHASRGRILQSSRKAALKEQFFYAPASRRGGKQVALRGRFTADSAIKLVEDSYKRTKVTFTHVRVDLLVGERGSFCCYQSYITMSIRNSALSFIPQYDAYAFDWSTTKNEVDV